jgi:diguanylate cyclase (GGDEF)-like protein/PAS domain S-box-containing protein
MTVEPQLIRVVVIDDDEDDFILVTDVIDRIPAMRCEVAWASNWGDGLAQIRDGAGDIYLVDYLLGAQSGIDLMREAATAGNRAPMILLTGQGNPEVDAAALAAGAADYLVKRDLDPERLSRAMRYALDRARAYQAVEEGEARYRLLFERNPMPLWVYDIETLAFLAVNDAMLDHYGYSREQLLGMTAIDIRPEEERETFDAYRRSRPRGLIKAGLWRHRRRDSSIIDVEVTSHSLVWEGREARLVLAHDVTERLRAEGAVRERENRLRNVLTDAIDALLVVSLDGSVVFANPAAGLLFDAAPEALIGAPFALPRVLDSEFSEAEVTTMSGQQHAIESRVSETVWDDQLARLVALRDVTERHRNEERLRVLERAIESTTNGVLISDARRPDMPTVYINAAFERMTGYGFDDIVGRNCRMLQGSDRDQPEVRLLREALREGRGCDVVLRNYRKDGTLFWNHLNVAPVRNERGEATHFVGIAVDITERRRHEAEMAYMATHDNVTGLPRYIAVEEFTRGAVADAGRTGGRVVMLYVDIDRFHSVNESMGHAVGDEALRVVAQRLRTVVGDDGRVSRIAGDEFVVVYLPTADDSEATALADRIRDAVEQPVAVPPYSVYLTASVGISAFPDSASNATELLNQAEAAMARAKRNGRNAVARFSNEQVQELADRLSLGSHLRDAARKGELLLHYQPQVSAQNGQVIGLEALVRWQSPELGFLPPGRFIRVAEELGLIADVGRWVLEHACQQARQWLDSGHHDFSVAVNVSALQLQRPTFVAEVRAALQSTGLPPRHLELELTESSIMDNVERMIETMTALRELGVRLALDDFGIGFSSLNHLKRFPIEKLKIDQSFVRDVTRDSGDAGIALAIIAMGHQLGMTVMAEGVETAAQMGYLRRNHCDQFQGLFFSGPVRADLAGELLGRRFLARESFSSAPEERTLLLLDDEENILRSLTRLLRRDGYKILTASNAREAFELLGRHEVHVVISDQRMPDISGTEFLSQVRALYPDTVRLVLSGYTDLRTVTEAINRGAIYKFLTKPWDDEELRREIREAFRTQADRRPATA